MSGGIVQLVATGAQDTWLSGNPEISFFRSNYKRYTHYAAAVERQILQGNPAPGSISTIRIEKKGDLLSYMYLTARDGNGSQVTNVDWSQVIDRIEFLIGGQVIDLHDVNYDTDIEPCTGAQNYNQRYLNNDLITSSSAPPLVATDSRLPTNRQATFYPFKFFFCKDWSVSLPLVALQYHDVEIRITWSQNLNNTITNLSASTGVTKYSQLTYQPWANFIYLDQSEREYFAQSTHDILITQVQRVPIAATPVQELALAHPVKFIAFQSVAYGNVYSTTSGGNQASNWGAGSVAASNYQLKVQINGVDVGESRPLPAWTDANQYYHTPYGFLGNNTETSILIIPYCLDTAKLQPTGTINFSRLDTYRLVVPTGLSVPAGYTNSGTTGLMALTNPAITAPYLYAVNYNVLRIQKGMGSVLYAN
jgi:hypothetical protein